MKTTKSKKEYMRAVCAQPANKIRKRITGNAWARAKYAADPAAARAATKEKHGRPTYQYMRHKNRAKHRGIDFLLSFEEWWRLWQPFWANKKGLVMARWGDTGPYSVNNVRITTTGDNVGEANILKPKRLGYRVPK